MTDAVRAALVLDLKPVLTGYLQDNKQTLEAGVPGPFKRWGLSLVFDDVIGSTGVLVSIFVDALDQIFSGDFSQLLARFLADPTTETLIAELGPPFAASVRIWHASFVARASGPLKRRIIDGVLSRIEADPAPLIRAVALGVQKGIANLIKVSKEAELGS